jgi:membrane protein DedA with SNARE-associated domain
VFTIAAGVAVLNFPVFVLASIIGRGARFFLVAGIVRYAGVRFEATLLRYIERIGWAVVVLSVVVIAYLMARG